MQSVYGAQRAVSLCHMQSAKTMPPEGFKQWRGNRVVDDGRGCLL
jgi:hypothetical protein